MIQAAISSPSAARPGGGVASISVPWERFESADSNAETDSMTRMATMYRGAGVSLSAQHPASGSTDFARFIPISEGVFILLTGHIEQSSATQGLKAFLE